MKFLTAALALILLIPAAAQASRECSMVKRNLAEKDLYVTCEINDNWYIRLDDVGGSWQENDTEFMFAFIVSTVAGVETASGGSREYLYIGNSGGAVAYPMRAAIRCFERYGGSGDRAIMACIRQIVEIP